MLVDYNINNNNNLNVNEQNAQNYVNPNINENDQNNIINNGERANEENLTFFQKFLKSQTFIFTLFLLMNCILFIFNIFFKFNLLNYSICEWPILYLNQYYRILTHHFFHMNFLHIFFNMLVFYFIGRSLEKRIGSLLTFLIIMKSIFLISFIYLVLIEILKYIVITTLKFKDYNYDFYSSVGFSGILFSIYDILCNFSRVAENIQTLFSFIPIRSKYLPIFYLFFNQSINPHSSYICHVAGIICGFIIKDVLVYITLPSKDSLISFEEHFAKSISFLEIKCNYVRIASIQDVNSLIDLAELDRGFFDLFIFKKIKDSIQKVFNRNNSSDQNILISTNSAINNQKAHLSNPNNNNQQNLRIGDYEMNNIHRLDEEN